MLITPLAYAKEVSLWNVPDDFTFATDTDTGPYIITYVGIENGLYRFDTTLPTTSEPHWILWRNVKSQTLKAGEAAPWEFYTPDDCLNTTEKCSFRFNWSDGTVDDVSSFTRRQNGVTYVEYYIDYDTGPSFWYLDCQTTDNFGFSMDLFQIDFEGGETWQQRTSSSTGEMSDISFYKLEKLCHTAYGSLHGDMM